MSPSVRAARLPRLDRLRQLLRQLRVHELRRLLDR